MSPCYLIYGNQVTCTMGHELAPKLGSVDRYILQETFFRRPKGEFDRQTDFSIQGRMIFISPLFIGKSKMAGEHTKREKERVGFETAKNCK